MTKRKPPGVSFETWVDRQIREAVERGAFDNLPGAGKPLSGLDEADDEYWWIKRKLREENLSLPLPGTLALRKEAEQALEAAANAPSEDEVRRIIEDINAKIVEGHRKAMSGPPLTLMPYDVEEILNEWRERHPPPPPAPAEPEPASRPPRRRLLSFLRRRTD